MTALLTIAHLRKSFRGIVALNDLSFTVQAGGITGLIGPNGSGKSTAIDCISGFQRGYGEVSLDGARLEHLAPERIARLGLTRTFQDVRVYDEFTLLENLLVTTAPFGAVGWPQALLRTPGFRRAQAAAEHRARDLIELVGLTRLIGAPAKILSYGQKKLLAIGMAMMSDPKLVVLDEPVAGVNPTRIHDVAAILRRANARGITFLIVEHNVDFITSLCDHVIVLDRGAKLTEGPPREIHRDQRVLDAYLGIDAAA